MNSNIKIILFYIIVLSYSTPPSPLQMLYINLESIIFIFKSLLK